MSTTRCSIQLYFCCCCFQLGKYHVCRDAIVREAKELDSPQANYVLPKGSQVNVVEIVGRRVRIDQPINGWCSLRSTKGDQILSLIRVTSLLEYLQVTVPVE